MSESKNSITNSSNFLFFLSFQTTSASLSPTKITATAPLAPPPNSDNENEHILRTKQVLERLFPNVPSTDVDYETWLENLSTYIEQQHQQQQQQENHVKLNSSNPTASTTTTTTTNNNHQHNGDGNSSNSDENITGNGNHHPAGDSQDDEESGKLSQSEELKIQNAKLKSIVAETSEILISLEKKACLQDAYWRSIVQSKDNEIRSLQQNSESST